MSRPPIRYAHGTDQAGHKKRYRYSFITARHSVRDPDPDFPRPRLSDHVPAAGSGECRFLRKSDDLAGGTQRTRLVQDRTGLAGPYNIELEFDFSAANQPDYTGQSIFTALKEQLGLKLVGSKGPLQVLVVESATPPGAN